MSVVSKAETGWPTGDAPGEFAFGFSVPADVSRAIAAVVPGTDGAEWRALAETEEPVGRFRVVGNGRPLFVRVSGDWGAPDLERGLIDHLQDGGVEVNGFIEAGLALDWDGRKLRVDARPFLTGAQHFSGSLDELRVLANTLRRCHQALKGYPRSAAIQARAQTRYTQLGSVRDFIGAAAKKRDWSAFHELAAWAEANGAWLCEMADGYDARLDLLPGAQCLHGEIHRANVLFNGEPPAAILIDFEESVRHFAPPAWDLAYLVQRFCLHDDPPLEVLRERLAAVEAGYGRPLPEIGGFMRTAAWFATAIIVDLCVRERVLKPLAECDKFVRLERQGRDFQNQ
ncbi:MAG: putative kinase, aminoglycoside phosphotransferase (APT) family [Verrucomicrobia bacterium]|nr:MAG: putative kinase, aminoglycoside phosphotransferase (APT) family [Verrucomicrobiota bacterium]